MIENIEEEQAATLNFLFEKNPVAMLIIRQGKIIAANAVFLEKIAYTREIVIGKKFLELCGGLNKVKYRQARQTFKKSGRIADLSLSIVAQDGRIIHGLFSGEERDYQGQKSYYLVMVDVTASVMQAEAKENAYDRLELILKSAGIGTCEWNIKTGESIYNARWAEIIGYKQEELPANVTSWETNTHPEDLSKAYAALQKHFYGETSFYSLESRMKHKDGSWIWVLNSGRVVEWDKKGKPFKMFITHIDITKLKETEEKLGEKERLFQTAFECAKVGLWDLNLRTRKVYLSPEYKRILGYEDLGGSEDYESWQSKIHPEDQPKLEQAMLAFRKGKLRNYEMAHRILNKKGEWQWVRARGGNFTNAKGQEHFIGTLVDITELMQEREKNAELEGVFAVNPDLLCIADVNEQFIKVNNAWTEILGYQPEEVEGHSFLEFIHPDDITSTKEQSELLAKQEKIEGFINRYRHKEGSYRYLDWRVHPYGRTLFGFARDITQRIKQEEDLKNKIKIQDAHLELMQLRDVSLDKLFERSLEEIIAITSSEIGYIFLYDQEKQEFLLHNWSKIVLAECKVKDQQRLYFLNNIGLWGEAVRQGREIIINDYQNYPGTKHGCPQGHLAIRKFLSLPVMDRGKIVAVVGVANKLEDYNNQDIINLKVLMNIVWAQSERIKAELQLAHEQVIFGAAIFSLSEAVIVTDYLGEIIVFNKQAEELTGWKSEQALGKELSEVFVLRDATSRETLASPAQLVLRMETEILSPINIINIAKDGKEHYIAGKAAPAINKQGKIIGAVINFRDITETWLKQKQDEYYSNRDALTGAYNRLFFERKIEEKLARVNRSQEELSMLILDLDHFKNVNDTWGHPVGDAVLKRTVEVANEVIRKTDYLVRLGGEEFIIVMPNTGIEGAAMVAEKIRKALEVNRHPQAGKVTASFGVAAWLSAETFLQWYERTDKALYIAKNSGRNKVIKAEAKQKTPLNYVQLKWESKWDSGNLSIDAEHQQLLDAGNKLISLAFSDATDQAIEAQLNFTIEHIEQHFANEEKLLLKIAYPQLKRHQKIHRGLLVRAAKLKDAHQRKKLKATTFFSFVLNELILKHMLMEDMLFTPYFKEYNKTKGGRLSN